MDAVAALTRLGGCATWGQLLGLTTGYAVRRASRRGRIVRLARGRYGLPAVEEHRREAHRRTAVLSHLSAASHHGWPVKHPPEQAWITVPCKRHLTPADRVGVHVTWRDLTPEEVEGGVTAPLRTVLDCALTLPFDEALVVADAALRSGDVRPHELAEAVTALHGIGSPQARRVAAAADGRAANAFESVLRAICLEVPGLSVTPQVALADDGIWVVVDLATPGCGWSSRRRASSSTARGAAWSVTAGASPRSPCWGGRSCGSRGGSHAPRGRTSCSTPRGCGGR